MGVTVVAGNSGLASTVRNALNILALRGQKTYLCTPDVGNRWNGIAEPVRRGIHGKDGLGTTGLMRRRSGRRKKSVDYLAETLNAAKEKVTLVCLGPLTNIAAAFRKCPNAGGMWNASRVIMGGRLYVPGNVTPAAEFNFYVDPEAAEIVMSSGCKIYFASA